MNGLAACPFCGKEAKICKFSTFDNELMKMGEKYYVECKGCGVDGPGFWWSQEEAANAWNKRSN